MTMGQSTRYPQRSLKLLLLFTLFVILFTIFLISIFRTVFSDRHLPTATTKIHDRSLRGSIISQDGYTLAQSKKTYQASIRAESLVPEKKELFIRLFSLFSNIPEQEIRKKLKDKQGHAITKGFIVLSRDIDSASAMQLKILGYELRKLDVFQSIKTASGVEILYGLDIIENGEKRLFPLKDVASPILGYVGEQREESGYIRPLGKQGLERFYHKYISYKQNGILEGKRDAVGTLIQNAKSTSIPRINGLDLHLNIPLSLQRRVEVILSQMQEELNADEIIAGVIESSTGKVLSLASSNRFSPDAISKNDIASLNPKFTEYLYEPGSVLKPFILALALDHKRVSVNTWFNLYGGRLNLSKRRVITDDHRFDKLTAGDIIVHSSNVGISQIAWQLTGKEFYDGLLGFGLSKPTGIDLARDLQGSIKPPSVLDHKLHRANSSYGYGMMMSFLQLLKGYIAFNNEGNIPVPRIGNYLEDDFGKYYTLPSEIEPLQAISPQTAKTMQQVLIDTVNRGTGVRAQFPGVTVGGKTGTAHMVKDGKYVDEYQSSFFGFANGTQNQKYTIGVLVIRPKKPRHYFASLSAVPTFKKIVGAMVDLGYITPAQIESIENKKLKTSPVEEPVVTPIEQAPVDAPVQPKQRPQKQTIQPIEKKPPSKIPKPTQLSPQDLFKNI